MERKQIVFSSIIIITIILLSVWGKITDKIIFASLSPMDVHSSNTSEIADVVFPGPLTVTENGDWPMVAANPHRTSWSSEEVSGNLQVEWYRPIEAYISQNTQIIAANGLLYISTARGLYALDADNGNVVWRFDTELPLGNSPTVDGNIVYVGGLDRQLHALNALTGVHLWSFDGAKAGYSSNPLIIDDKVILGNRDGATYAIGKHGSINQGQLIWQHQAGGPIYMSTAYNDGVIYFAAGDNYAYAVNVNNGAPLWKSPNKLPGEQYQSYWPVIYRDKVIFTGAQAYRAERAPGTKSISGGGFTRYLDMQLADIFPGASEGTMIGAEDPAQTALGWAHGFPVINASSITEYLEENPQVDLHKHKPWRRLMAVLNISNGQEFTFDSDNDGHLEYIPIGHWGTTSGNRYPPIVGSDNILYVSNIFRCCSDEKGRIMGWNIDHPSYFSLLGSLSSQTGGYGALAEPQAISAGGDLVYRNLCCDRVGDWANYLNPGQQSGTVWSYNLNQQAPGYDPMWFIVPNAISRHQGWYNGNTNSMNAAYHNHGDQNPIIPYNGRLYTHRSNTIFAFGPGSGSGLLPTLTINSGQDTSKPLSTADIRNRLEDEVQKIVDAGHLRPGYYNSTTLVRGVENYFENPGDTLHTLARAYPYLSSSLRTQVSAYLKSEFDTYFNNEMYARTGWSGAAREGMEMPPEITDDIAAGNYPPKSGAGSGFMWAYPQHNFYAMWKYAELVPRVNAKTLYNLAKSRLMVPVPNPPIGQTEYFRQQPYELNAWIAGYIGFLELQELAGMSDIDATLRNQVITERDRLINMRVNIFTKESYWNNPSDPEFRYYKKSFDVVRNFLFLVPELADHLRQNKLTEVQAAIHEYDYIAPYWFVSRYEASIGERGMSLLYNYHSLFQAKALIIKETPEELSKYIDVPAFEVGDLLYLQNLIALLEASPYFWISPDPSFQSIDPGGDAQYSIQVILTNGFNQIIALDHSEDFPDLDVDINPQMIDPNEENSATLTLSHEHSGTGSKLLPGLWFTFPVTATGSGITDTISVNLLVGGDKSFSPLISKNH